MKLTLNINSKHAQVNSCPGATIAFCSHAEVTSARQVTQCCTTSNQPLEVAPGQRKTHVNSNRCQTVGRGTRSTRLRSHGNDIVPLSYRSDCLERKSSLFTWVWSVIEPILDPVHTGTLSYRSLTFRTKQTKENLICLQISNTAK